MKFLSAQSEQLAQSLLNVIVGDVYVDEYHRALYSTDASPYQIQPLAVVVPRTYDDVRVAVKAAFEAGVPIIPRGGGTSLSGQSIGPGLILDFSKYLNQIVALDPVRQTARVQPGVILDSLNAAAAKHGLQFGPDVATSSRANLGGMIGNNSAGSRSIRYGKTVDNVIELEVLLPDGSQATLGPLDPTALDKQQARTDRWGEIYRTLPLLIAREADEILARFPPILRRVSGYNLDEFVPEHRLRMPAPPGVALVRGREAEQYPAADFNLAKLLVGAEGTLGVITEALVHLVPMPRHRGIIVLHFETLAAAVACTQVALACEPSAVELLDGQIVRMARQSLEYRHYLDFVVGEPESLMLVEFSGEDVAEVRAAAEEFIAGVRNAPGLYHAFPAFEPRLCDHIWACRKAALPLLMGVPGLRKPVAFVEDTAVDPRKLDEFVARFRAIMAAEGTFGAFYGHASVGCLHIRPMLDLADRGDLGRLERISLAVGKLVQEFGGAMSGEHGDGLARSYLNPELFGPKIYEAFRQVKGVFDPTNLMNPGKIVDGPSPIANLRQGADYQALPVTTVFDFSREGGLARAAEMCNGAGVCRKLRPGTMCPSFMATGDEEHSTRGRANALRLALSGALPASELTGPKLHATYDLCLQCKGCKAECPSNVDVAKLKAEFLYHYHAANGASLGSRVMANVATLNRWGARLSPIPELLGRLPGSRWMAEKLLGIDARRPLPTFARNHFRRWFAKHGEATKPRAASLGPIVLLDDCLTSYCEPRVNRAAVEVLEACGYEVHTAGLECCGRAHISKGFLTEAKRLAQENIARLQPWAARGVPIVGCEPSCLLTLTDEYLDLVPGDAARQVAAAASLVETHLVRANVSLPALRPQPGAAILHGHCHQKALVGMADTVALLGKIPELKTTLLDSGCCGMAGSFGYEHYNVSMKIGERVLLPAVREAPSAAILAPGISCRGQIEHGAGRIAEHPIVMLRNAINGG